MSLSALFKGSFALFRKGAGELAAIVALGLLPNFLLTTLALVGTGLSDPEAMAQVMAGEHLGRLGVVAAARLAGQAAAFAATLALLLAIDARDRGAPLGVKRAFAEAGALIWPYFATMARVFLYVAVGLLVFLAPGVLLGALFFFAAPAVAVDGLSGPHALAKSRQLVVHQPRRVVVYLLAALGAAAAAGALGARALEGLVRLARPPMGVPAWQLLWYLRRCVGGLALAWAASFAVLFYKDLSSAAAGQ